MTSRSSQPSPPATKTTTAKQPPPPRWRRWPRPLWRPAAAAATAAAAAAGALLSPPRARSPSPDNIVDPHAFSPIAGKPRPVRDQPQAENSTTTQRKGLGIYDAILSAKKERIDKMEQRKKRAEGQSPAAKQTPSLTAQQLQALGPGPESTPPKQPSHHSGRSGQLGPGAPPLSVESHRFHPTRILARSNSKRGIEVPVTTGTPSPRPGPMRGGPGSVFSFGSAGNGGGSGLNGPTTLGASSPAGGSRHVRRDSYDYSKGQGGGYAQRRPHGLTLEEHAALQLRMRQEHEARRRLQKKAAQTGPLPSPASPSVNTPPRRPFHTALSVESLKQRTQDQHAGGLQRKNSGTSQGGVSRLTVPTFENDLQIEPALTTSDEDDDGEAAAAPSVAAVAPSPVAAGGGSGNGGGGGGGGPAVPSQSEEPQSGQHRGPSRLQPHSWETEARQRSATGRELNNNPT
mmetsp:Transcript_32468/g.56123  ORF Transcript_32468/g.56123 Transcript_32468/m.56123 type:complete len:458 (-) Transcript_32468:224-1597(-)